MASRSDVKAFNHDQGDDAAVVGPTRSRIRQILIFGNSAGALTITDGNGGANLLVQSFPTGAIGLQISGTDNSAFTNYTATNAENKDESISTRTVGENTLIGGTMDNRNVKTFTFTEQGSDTDTTTASTDIVLTSQKDFGIFYSTFANDSGGEDLNVLRTAGGYMKEAYILDGDIIDDIDAINLELRQHYNLA